MAKILVIYYTRKFPMRASQRDYLFSFKRYAGKRNECYYVNLFSNAYLNLYKNVSFDLVIFTWSFLDSRFMRESYISSLHKIDFITNLPCPKIMMPQDEFSHSDLLNFTANFFKITHIYSVSPSSEWEKIYKEVDFNTVKFKQLLTGYIEDSLIKKIEKLEKRNGNTRTIDVGYRSGAAAYWGRFNLIKFKLAEAFFEASSKYNLRTDIDFGWNKFLLGDDWYLFLLKCRYMPGVEGGSSIIDWDGSIVSAVQGYLKQNPSASYDDVEANCIPEGKDGEIHVVAISPRHLEACLTRTCQILVKGYYNGVLEAGKHYIELEPDFSNLHEVCSQLNDESKRLAIVNNAYNDIVVSGKYSYKAMVQNLINSLTNYTSKQSLKSRFFYYLHDFIDKLNVGYVYLFSIGREIRNYYNGLTNSK